MEKYLTLVPYSPTPVEVELDHWFRADMKRLAVIYTVDDHGERHWHVREEKHLTPLKTAADAA